MQTPKSPPQATLSGERPIAISAATPEASGCNVDIDGSTESAR